ncbi:NAD-dependent succinate-semialdehyde dehydrogenase [Apilactobacillus timberlakei]|uniref:NAD-dependent succinate-semialdehyde dehydrogenase n=1 Tax=Apilactobacillus timberlakei TaxID=2008380 RepID=UPI0011283817|nr:NAD-dependent succinate-semialdehyde dehydrogenase [Apilactobacillus timberlakei]TPR19549.1 NAD-dependent succinate-semialdehyde dehydrogenase [Apilactobacillus timberlakei]TPR20526.1 NAD-dependent succinate-semialdehyde dehydrogenase [Apilactobacillus timberlakei]TPR22570.1 NAD-dependent succinate-semialdehyde dehydrogenase [Apilactobacillus timberlakei]
MAYITTYPYTNEVLKEYKSMSDEDVEAALDKAGKLYQSWKNKPVTSRKYYLENVADLMLNNCDSLAKTIVKDMGKLYTEAVAEVKLSASIAKYYAENGEKFLSPKPLLTSAGNSWVENNPVGIVMCVEPWNFPYYQLMRVFATNFMAGNPVMVKHASNCPGCALAFEKIIKESGAPEAAYQNLFVSHEQIANIIADKRVQGVALTGSEKAGTHIAAEAGKNLKKSTMELGGNDVMVILDDVDIKKAAKLAAYARLWNAGQVCVSSKRYIVEQRIADKFMTALKAEFAKYQPGDPMDENTTLAPLSSKGAQTNLDQQVKNAVKNGAKIEYGGGILDMQGDFYNPTILSNISKDNPAYYEEFFGPVAQFYVAKDDADAIRIANDSNYGLGGSIVAKDHERASKMASKIDTGMVFVNGITQVAYPELPFGGIKRSGYGRELGPDGIKSFVNQKLISITK